jgi:hypothetical protein
VLLVISHRDSGEVNQQDLTALTADAAARGITLDAVPIASFKRKGGESQAGFGIANLIAKTIGQTPVAPRFWPARVGPPEPRAMLAFGSWSAAQ